MLKVIINVINSKCSTIITQSSYLCYSIGKKVLGIDGLVQIMFLIVNQFIEKQRGFNLRETHTTLTDYEKAFDHINREKLWIKMNWKGSPQL